VLLPLDVLKIKRQVNPETFRGRGVLRIVADEGFALYRGWGWTMARNAPGSFAVCIPLCHSVRQPKPNAQSILSYTVQLFGASALTKDVVLGIQDYSKATWTQNFIASVAGAVTSITVAAPLDVVKTRIQNSNFEQNVKGVTVIRELIRNEGISALFKGLTPKARIRVINPGPRANTNSACLVIDHCCWTQAGVQLHHRAVFDTFLRAICLIHFIMSPPLR
jgi:hypothetical protein